MPLSRSASADSKPRARPATAETIARRRQGPQPEPSPLDWLLRRRQSVPRRLLNVRMRTVWPPSWRTSRTAMLHPSLENRRLRVLQRMRHHHPDEHMIGSACCGVESPRQCLLPQLLPYCRKGVVVKTNYPSKCYRFSHGTVENRRKQTVTTNTKMSLNVTRAESPLKMLGCRTSLGLHYACRKAQHYLRILHGDRGEEGSHRRPLP